MESDVSPTSASTATATTNPTQTSSSRPVSSHLSLSPNDTSSPLAQNSSTSSLEHETSTTSPAGSSNTSHSIPSSPRAGPVQGLGQEDVPGIELAHMDDTEVESPSSSATGPSPFERRQPRRSVPDAATKQDEGTNRLPVLARLTNCLRKKFWFSNTVGFIALLVSAVGLLFFGWRTYKLGVNANEISYMDICFNRPATLLDPSSQCDAYTEKFTKGRMKPPYEISKRVIETAGKVKRYLMMREGDIVQETARASTTFLPTGRIRQGQSLGWQETEDGTSNPKTFQSVKIAITTAIVILAGSWCILRRMRRNANVEGPFTSLVRSDLHRVELKRYFTDAPEQVTSGDGYKVLKHNPDEKHYLGQLRQRIRNSQQSNMSTSQKSVDWASHNNSADTLVSQNSRRRSTPSKINLHHSIASDNVEYEGVIELPAKGKTKNFFDPKTGEFIHLAPWRSNAYEDENSEDDEVAKGQVKQAFAQMTTGGTALAGGQTIDQKFHEEMEKWQSQAEEQKQRIPQRAGDCLAGVVTNECPTGRPRTV